MFTKSRIFVYIKIDIFIVVYDVTSTDCTVMTSSLVVEAKNPGAPGQNSNTSIFGTIGSGILSSISKKKSPLAAR